MEFRGYKDYFSWKKIIVRGKEIKRKYLNIFDFSFNYSKKSKNIYFW